MASAKDFLADLQLYADDVECVLICCRCGYALSVTGSQATSTFEINTMFRGSSGMALLVISSTYILNPRSSRNVIDMPEITPMMWDRLQEGQIRKEEKKKRPRVESQKIRWTINKA
jgi:hypothetical protein